MPCYTVQEFSVEFKAKNRALLVKALDRLRATGEIASWSEASGVIYAYTKAYDRFDIDLSEQTAVSYDGTAVQSTINKLKQEYSRQALAAVTQKTAGKWVVQASAGNQYAGMIRRGG